MPERPCLLFHSNLPGMEACVFNKGNRKRWVSAAHGAVRLLVPPGARPSQTHNKGGGGAAFWENTNAALKKTRREERRDARNKLKG